MAAALTRRNLLISLAVLASVAPASAWAAVPGEWQNLGPDGGSVYDLAFEPGNPQVIYAGVDGGVYKSTNGGADWTYAGWGLDFSLRVDQLAIDPAHPSTVYASQGSGIAKSTDGGQSWRRISPERLGIFDVAVHPQVSTTLFAAASGGLYRSANGGAAWTRLKRGLPRLYRARMVHIDSSSPGQIFASIQDANLRTVGLFRSTDGGNSWRPAHRGSLGSREVLALAFDPQSPETLYAGTEAGVHKSADGGASWTGLELEEAGRVEDLAVHPTRSGVLYAGTAAGLFRSEDGGATWVRLAAGLPAAGSVSALAFAPAAETLWAGVVTEIGRSGVFASADDGSSWTLRSHGLSALLVSSVAVDPQSSDTLWVTANTLLFKSTDRGQTWARIRPDPGAEEVLAHFVFVDPRDPATVYVVLFDGGLRRTRNGGQTWEVAGHPRVNPLELVIDPQASSTLYAAGYQGIAKSTDRGNTWTELAGDAGAGYFYNLAISPSSPSTLYAAGSTGNQQRLLRTTDAGATWIDVQEDLPLFFFGLAVDALTPTTVYTSSAGHIYRSRNGGETWSRVSNAFRNRTAHPLVASPTDSGVLYAAVWYGHVYESTDGGETWSPLGEGPGSVVFSDLAVDPQDPCRIYAGTRNRGLLAFTKSDGC